MQRQALRIAVSVAPDFGLGAWGIDKRIVRRHRAIRADAYDLAEMICKVLRLIARGEMLAQGQEQVVVLRLHDAAAEMIAARERALLAEDDCQIGEPRRWLLDQPRACERRARAAARGLGMAVIDRVIVGKGSVENDIVQPALTRCEHLRHAA